VKKRIIILAILAFFLSGCATTGMAGNEPDFKKDILIEISWAENTCDYLKKEIERL